MKSSRAKRSNLEDIFFYILLAIFSLSNPIYAITEVVRSGTVQPNTVNLLVDGDEAIVEAGGAIATTNDGVIMGASNQMVLNLGSIFSTENNGILNLDENNVINNNGLISGGNLAGIRNEGENAVIINNGRILNANTGIGPFGIDNRADNAMIINNGLILTINRFAIANQQGAGQGENLSIINSGRIEAFNDIAIENTQPNFTLLNSGSIITHDRTANTITSSGDNTFINNSGLIFSDRLSDGAFNFLNNDNTVVINSGILASSGNTAVRGVINTANTAENIHIINSGIIQRTDPSTGHRALLLEGPDPTLSLLRGSNIEGSVLVSDPLNLNVETGLNLALTLASGSGGFGALGIEAPFALVGDTITVIDPTGFALQNDVLADLSDTIFDGIYRHRTGFPCPCAPCGCGIWVQGIGSSRERGRNTKRVGYDNWQGGFLVGYDAPVCGGYSSFFGGISFGEAEVDARTQQTDWTTYLWGLTYEWVNCDTFLGWAYAIGYVDWHNERFVMNNLADGGVETSTADTGGAFISTEVTASKHFPSLFCSTLSFSLRYAGLFLGDYNERGSDADLSVKEREIDLLTTRFEVAFPYQNSKGVCCWVVEPYLGVFGRYKVGGGRVDAFLLGQSLCFDPGNPDDLVAFLLGFRGTQSFNRWNLFLNLEASFDNHSSARILGEGGIGLTF